MEKTTLKKNRKAKINSEYEPIAIIGIGCRFPGGANDPYTFWENIKNGKDCIMETPKERWDTDKHYSSKRNYKGKLLSKWGGYIDGVDEFDPSFFGITPREAEVMDPQQRKLLEVTWEAMEDAGKKPSELAGTNVGVFIGGFTSDYKILQFTNPEFDNLNSHSATGIMMTMLSNRLSYIFDFKGPSMSIDTACSSSLVAIHLACKSLQQNESNLAIAGGVLITLAPQYTISESKGGFLSPTGSSHAYDDSANGYVRAEGAGVIVLKKLSAAIADGDLIHAVIKGSGVNQDGRTNGITVPNGEAQYQLMKETYMKAGIAPNTIQYVETHGTGTPVGDPIEANSVGRLISEGRKKGSKCYIGSVKTNIGHTESAAGVAGLIKVVMALKHKQIPPHLHLKNINPAINIKNHAYEIPTELVDWPTVKGPATAGVNSFGFGGTNSHVILQEYIPDEVKENTLQEDQHLPEIKLFPITAKAEDVLTSMAKTYEDFLKKSIPSVSLNDIAFSCSNKREFHQHRLAFTYKNEEELITKLLSFQEDEQSSIVKGRVIQEQHKKLVWVFTGMGPQWWGMGRQLYAKEPIFKSVIDACDKEMSKHVKWSLLKELLADEADSKMAETWISQPANFAIQVALAALWRSYGIQPDVIVGHSTGEAAAFFEAGVYSFQDAIKITINRSRLQHLLHGEGKMLAVGLSTEAAEPFIAKYKEYVSIAAVNSPSGVTLAGEEKSLKEIAEVLTQNSIFNKFLQVEVPYHSVVMDKIKEQLIEVLADIRPQPTTTPLYSTVTGHLAMGTELDNYYWWRNVRDTVLFSTAIQNIVNEDCGMFLEIGPHPTLAGAIKEILDAEQKTGIILTSLRRKEDEQQQFMQSLGQLFTHGLEINWDRFYPQGKFVRLPNYAWRKDKYWIEPLFFNQIRKGDNEHTLLGNRRLPADTVWHSSVSMDKHAYLADHSIQGNVVFPAAGYVEMIYAALQTKWGRSRYVIEDLSIDKALFITDENVPNLKLVLDEQTAQFRILSYDNEQSKEPTTHSSGLFRKAQKMNLQLLSLSELQSKFDQQYDASQFYAILNEFGYNYGPAFQGIKNIWATEDQLLAKISLPEQLKDKAYEYHLHPSLLDACFQTLVFNDLNASGMNRDSIRLPVKIESICIDGLQLTELWCHTVIISKDEEKTIGNIYLYTPAGKQLGVIEGFIAQRVDTVGNNIKTSTIDSWLYTSGIEKAAVVEQSNPITNESKGYWVVFADEQGVAEMLTMKLRKAGQNVCMVKPAEYFQLDRKSLSATIAAASKEEISQLFSTLKEITNSDCKGIVHLWNIDAVQTEQLNGNGMHKSKRTGIHSVFQLAKVIQEEEIKGKLFIVTKNAQPFGHVVNSINVMASSVWGLGRVLAQKELTENWGRLIDLDETDLTEQHSEQLFNELEYADKEQEIVYRNGERYVPRILPATNPDTTFPIRLRSDGAYIVTGAFGAIGRLVANYLIQHGATRLILVSRSSFPERSNWDQLTDTDVVFERIQFVKELESKGASVLLSEIDVTQENEVKEFLESYKKQGFPPIRGLFFCAGLIKDALLSKMDIGSFDYVYSTKVTGSYILHRLLDNNELDHFVLFSSVAAQITTAGQTNYAAGNAFLDALAHYRRANGLPGISINWGPWAIGMIKENNLIEHYKYQRGMNCILPDSGMQIMNRILGLEAPQYIVCDADWSVVLNWYETKPKLFAHLSTDTETTKGNQNLNFEDDYRTIAESERMEFVKDKLIDRVSQVLRCKKSTVDHNSSLISIGLDSIMATELKNKISAYFTETFPFVKLLSNSTINQLATELNDKLNVKFAFDESNVLSSGSDNEILIANEATETTVNIGKPEEVVEEFPLSYGQQAIWFIHEMQPLSPAYNIGGAMHIPSTINIDALRKAIREVIQRHPSLRTNFFIKDGKPYQRVYASRDEDITVINVAGMDEAAIRKLIIEDNNKPFNIEKDALYRIRLYQQAKDSNYFAVSIYHIISDAWSNYMFIDEMQALYAKYAHNAPVQLPELTADYSDFVSWEQKNISGEKGEKMLDFWKNNLPEEISVIQLPFDRPRPKIQRNEGDSFTFEIDSKLTEQLKALSRSEGITMYITLLGIYHILMHKYSGQEDIIVGSPVSGRTNQQFDRVYGYFVNPLPIWANFKEDRSFRDFVQQLRMRVLSSIENQEYPFALLVNKLGLNHDASYSAVFQVLFVLLNHRVEQSHMDANNVAYYKGFPMHLMQIPEEEGQFDLTLTVYEENNVYKCTLKYNTHLFNKDTIEQLSVHYLLLAKQIASNPQGLLSVHSLLTTAERANILGKWKGFAKPLNRGITIAEKIHEISQQLPENIACKLAGDKTNVSAISYAVLNATANQLANYLIREGLHGNSPVCICMKKSAELIIAITGVLKSGGYFIPIDPEQPEDRIHKIVKDTHASFIITDEICSFALPAKIKQIVMDKKKSIIRTSPDSEPAVSPQLSDIAYAIYTSGSTGEPKGVMVTHGNWMSIFECWYDHYELVKTTVHLQLANINFDVFCGDFIRALACGKKLLLSTKETTMNIPLLVDIINTEKVDIAEFVPSLIRPLINYCEQSGVRPDKMKVMLVGSDYWTIGEYKQLKEACKNNVRVISTYGTTETTIDTSYFEGDATEYTHDRFVPIGKAFSNSELFILDAHHKPVPAGVPGELYIGGYGVTKGYLNAPGLTDSRFMTIKPDGKTIVPVYKTGDMARWSKSGNVELIGRLDNQLKVRGQRLDPSEIEHVACSLKEIEQAVVAVKYNIKKEQVLCLYYTIGNNVADEKELLMQLSTQLPSYMVPAHVMKLTTFPLSANGKIDRKKLPDPAAKEVNRETERPTTLYEQKIAEIWRSILHVQDISVTDDFFSLGGNSLHLIELLVHLQKEFNCRFSINQLYLNPVLQAIARVVDHVVTGKEEGALPYQVYNKENETILFCFPPAGGFSMVYKSLADALPDVQFVSFNYLAEHDNLDLYLNEIKKVQPEGPYLLFGYSIGGNLAFEICSALEKQGDKVAQVVIMDSYRINETVVMREQDYKHFEEELSEHFKKHVGSALIESHVMEQAKQYINYMYEQKNLNTISSELHFITEQNPDDPNRKIRKKSWDKASSRAVTVHTGFGKHADMLDKNKNHVIQNADLISSILKKVSLKENVF